MFNSCQSEDWVSLYAPLYVSVESAVTTFTYCNYHHTAVFSSRWLNVHNYVFIFFFNQRQHNLIPVNPYSLLVENSFFHYFKRIWPYWKMDTGKHYLHEILLLF